jgi:5-methylthioribose kinase
MTSLETNFDQLKREYVWNSGDVSNSYYSYFDVTGYDEDECDADEVFSYLCSLDMNPTLSDIALKYGKLWDTTQQEKYVDLGVVELTKELERIWK